MHVSYLMLVVYVVNCVHCTAYYTTKRMTSSQLQTRGSPANILMVCLTTTVFIAFYVAIGSLLAEVYICVLIFELYHFTEIATNGLCPDFEMCCFDVCNYNTSIRFAQVYHPPDNKSCIANHILCLGTFFNIKLPWRLQLWQY